MENATQNVERGFFLAGIRSFSHFLFLGLSLVSLLIPLLVTLLQIFPSQRKLSLNGLPINRAVSHAGRAQRTEARVSCRLGAPARSPRFARKWRRQSQSMTAAHVQPIPPSPPVRFRRLLTAPFYPCAALTPRPPGRRGNGQVAPLPPPHCPRIPCIYCPGHRSGREGSPAEASRTQLRAALISGSSLGRRAGG